MDVNLDACDATWDDIFAGYTGKVLTEDHLE
jgi:hypothetical protein